MHANCIALTRWKCTNDHTVAISCRMHHSQHGFGCVLQPAIRVCINTYQDIATFEGNAIKLDNASSRRGLGKPYACIELRCDWKASADILNDFREQRFLEVITEDDNRGIIPHVHFACIFFTNQLKTRCRRCASRQRNRVGDALVECF